MTKVIVRPTSRITVSRKQDVLPFNTIYIQEGSSNTAIKVGNITISPDDPSSSIGNDGDLWIKVVL